MAADLATMNTKCCMADRYGNWCKNEETRLIGDKYYCIFHAPSTKKHEFDIDIEELITTKIQGTYTRIALKRSGQVDFSPEQTICNFSGSIFTNNINKKLFEIAHANFKRQNSHPSQNSLTDSLMPYSSENDFFIPEVNFENSLFCGTVDFSDSTFENSIIFDNCTFKDSAIFFKTIFKQICSLINSKFEADIYFQEVELFSKIDFSNSKFNDHAVFNNSSFRSLVGFMRCEFNGDLSLSNSKFEDTVDFTKSNFNQELISTDTLFKTVIFIFCSFKDRIDFSNCIFQEESSFSNSMFNKSATFFDAEFKKEINFKHCLFRGDSFWAGIVASKKATFLNSKFMGYSFWDDSLFEADVDMYSCCFNELEMNNAILTKSVNFNNSTFLKSSFENTRFNGPVYFNNTIFIEETIFDKVIFNDYINFENCDFCSETYFLQSLFDNWVYFRDSIFYKKTSFAGSICKEKILIERSDIEHLSLANTNIDHFDFIDCKWGKTKYAPIYDDTYQNIVGINDATLETIYRRLKVKARDRADEMQTSHWHFREKEIQKKQFNLALRNSTAGNIATIATLAIFIITLISSTAPYTMIGLSSLIAIFLTHKLLAAGKVARKKAERNILKIEWFTALYLNIYYYISGYGERPLRAFSILLSLIVCPYLLSQAIKVSEPCMNFNWENYIPLLHPLKDSQPCEAVWQLFITLQAALFVFALRNKLRR